MGKTTVDIDNSLIEEALSITHLKTKKAVIERALTELINKSKREIFRTKLGTFDLDLTPEKLNELRSGE